MRGFPGKGIELFFFSFSYSLIFISVAFCIATVHCHLHWHVTPFVYCVLSCILFSPLERPQFRGNCFFCYHHSALASANPFVCCRHFSFWGYKKVQSERMEGSLWLVERPIFKVLIKTDYFGGPLTRTSILSFFLPLSFLLLPSCTLVLHRVWTV